MNEIDPHRPADIHDLARELSARKADLIAAAGREADLRWTVERLRCEVKASERREAALRVEIATVEERFAAMRTVLDACAASAGPFGLRRRLFLKLVRKAGDALPDDGPQSARHAVLLAEGRRVLQRTRG